MSTKHYKTPVNSVALPQHLSILETVSCHTLSRCQHHALGLHDFSNYELNKFLFFYQLSSLRKSITATENRLMSITRDSLTFPPVFSSFCPFPFWAHAPLELSKHTWSIAQRLLRNLVVVLCLTETPYYPKIFSFLFLSNSDHVSQVFG